MNDLFETLPFRPADILLPQNCDLGLWSVVACDQYTSQPEYWQRVEERVGRAPSSLRLILPESCLDGPSVETDIMEINNTMSRYLREERFALLPQTMIYVERTLHNGKLRRGLVGMVDLEQYDYEPGSPAQVRATEGTVLSRIPPRVAVRKNAPIELPHVMLLTDDPERTVIEPLAREKAGILPCPMMAVNDAKAKHYYDNKYGTGQSTWDAIMHTTNLMVAGKTVVVAGYGWCGKGIAMRAKGMGANVIVTEVDPFKAMEATMENFRVMPMDEAARYGDIFVTATGCKDVIVERHFQVMKHNVLLCNSGHFDCEVDVARLGQLAEERFPRRAGIEGFRLPDGRVLNVLAEGRLVNLAAGNGLPAEIMDMSFAVQALSLEWMARHAGKLEKKVYNVPEEIDDQIGRVKLAAMGLSIDTLTQEQKDYLAGWEA